MGKTLEYGKLIDDHLKLLASYDRLEGELVSCKDEVRGVCNEMKSKQEQHVFEISKVEDELSQCKSSYMIERRQMVMQNEDLKEIIESNGKIQIELQRKVNRLEDLHKDEMSRMKIEMKRMRESKESKLKSAKDMFVSEIGEVRAEANAIIASLESEVEKLNENLKR